jgi:hypothetical protein
MKTEKLFHRTEEIINIKEISLECYHDLMFFQDYLTQLSETASKKTHYVGLDEWSDSVHNFVDKKLKQYGFVNGKPEIIKPNSNIWFNIYAMISNVIYSPNLKTKVANHHSSAFERNEALLKEIEIIINYYNNKFNQHANN